MQIVCHAVDCAKTAKRIDVLLGMEAPGDPRNIALGGGGFHPHGEGEFDAVFAKLL